MPSATGAVAAATAEPGPEEILGTGMAEKSHLSIRSYQQDLVDIAKRNNVIISLATGPKVKVDATITAKADSKNAAPAAAKSAGTPGLAAGANAYNLGKNMGHILASGLNTDAFATLKYMVDTQMYSLGKAMGPVLAKAGMAAEKVEQFMAPVRTSAGNMLSGLDAVRSAYEKTLKGYYGLLLDNTAQLRNTLEDGSSLIKNIYTLTGTKCTEAKFTPPAFKPASIAGWGSKFTVTTGGCSLTRAAAPLKKDFVLKCTEPSVTLETKAPRYSHNFVAAAKATSEECKTTRKYGVESETTITLLDPAAFFAAAAESSKAGAAANATASNTGDLNKASAWYQGMFPVSGEAGDSFKFVPAGVSEAVAKALTEIQIGTTFKYTPFNAASELQDVANSLVTILEQQLKVTSKTVQVYKENAEFWMNPEKRAEGLKDLSFAENLRQSMSSMNMSSLFDGMFAKKASALLQKTPLAGQVWQGKAAAAAAGFLGQVAGEQPLRTLLAQARKGAGKPVSMAIDANLEEAIKAMSGPMEAVRAAAAANVKSKAPSLGQLLQKNPEFGKNIKQLADLLQGAMQGLGLGA